MLVVIEVVIDASSKDSSQLILYVWEGVSNYKEDCRGIVRRHISGQAAGPLGLSGGQASGGQTWLQGALNIVGSATSKHRQDYRFKA